MKNETIIELAVAAVGLILAGTLLLIDYLDRRQLRHIRQAMLFNHLRTVSSRMFWDNIRELQDQQQQAYLTLARHIEAAPAWPGAEQVVPSPDDRYADKTGSGTGAGPE